MSVARITALGIGASLVGSAPGIIASGWFWTLPASILGLLLVLLGTGFLQAYVFRPILRRWRQAFPAVAIVNDLPWPTASASEGTYVWAWSKMSPDQWHSKIFEDAKRRQVKVAVRLINLTSRWTGWWARFRLDRYSAILNPYGSLYPEVNTRDLPVLNTILDYVLNGGLFVNVADIPFYWAYDPEKQTRSDLVRHTYQYVPVEYELQGRSLHLRRLTMQSFGPFAEHPFLAAVRVVIQNTEKGINGKIVPTKLPLELREDITTTGVGFSELGDIAINRAVVIPSEASATEYGTVRMPGFDRIQSVVRPITGNGRLLTPICYVRYGKGNFLASLLFMDYEHQPEEVRERVTALLCALILGEIKHNSQSIVHYEKE